MTQCFKHSCSKGLLKDEAHLKIFSLNMKHVLSAEDFRILNKYKTQFIHPSGRSHPADGPKAQEDNMHGCNKRQNTGFSPGFSPRHYCLLICLSLRNLQEHLRTSIRCVLISVYREQNLTLTRRAGTRWPGCVWMSDIKALFLLWPR